MMFQSTINDYAYYNSYEYDAESDSNSDPLVPTQTSDRKKIKVTDTDTTNGNSPHKILINRIIPETISVIASPINQMTKDGVAASGGTLYGGCTILSKDIITDAARSVARVFKDRLVVKWKDTDRKIPFRNPPQID